MPEVVERVIRIRGESSGIEKMTADLQKLAAANENVAVTTEKTSRAQLSAEKTLQRLERQWDTAARQAQDLAKVTKDLERVKAQGLITDERSNQILSNVVASHQRVNNAQKSLVDSTKLTRYEMINLSRQVQDVGVSLASGQSAFTVLIQQGTQIADVFAASQSTMAGFFNQVKIGATAFFTPFRIATTAAVGFGAAALAVATNWDSAQTKIQQGLAGMGRVSGATAQDIVGVGKSVSSLTGLSEGAARDIALSFAKVGIVVPEQLKQATRVTEDFAKNVGINADEAGKKLAEAFSQGLPGIEGVLRSVGAFDGRTHDLLSTLDQSIDKTKLQAAAFGILEQNLRRASDLTPTTEKLLNAIINVGKEIVTLPEPPARTEQRVAIEKEIAAQEELLGIQQRQAAAFTKGGIQERERAAAAEKTAQKIYELNASLQQLNATTEQARLSKIVNPMLDIINAANPAIEKIKQLEKEIMQLQELQEMMRTQPAIREKMGAAAEQVQPTIERRQFEVTGLKEAEAQQKRINDEITKTAALYGNVSQATGQILKGLDEQMAKANAVTVTQQLQVQYQQTYADALVKTGSEEQAALIATKQREAAQAQINTQAQQNLNTLKDQQAILAATTELEKQRAQAAATTAQMTRANVDPAIIEQTVKQQTLNTQTQINAAANVQLQQLQSQEAVAGALSAEDRLRAQEQATIADLIRQGVSAQEAAKIAAQQTANAYAQISANMANMLQDLQMQESISGAISAKERMIAQNQATIVQLRRQGATAAQATAIADQQTANAQAQIDANAERTLRSAQQQLTIASAIGEQEKGRAREQVRIEQLMDQGVSLYQAEEIAATELAATEAQRHAESEEAITRERDQRFEAEASAKRIGEADAARINYMQQTADLAEKEAYAREKSQRAAAGMSEFGGFMDTSRLGGESAFGGPASFSTGMPADAIVNQATGEVTWRGRTAESMEGIKRMIAAENATGARIRAEIAARTARMEADVLLGQGVSYQGLIDKMLGQTVEQDKAENFFQTLADAASKTGISEVPNLQRIISRASQEPASFARDDLIQQLNDRIKELTESTDDLAASNRSILSELYTTDPRLSHLGFRAKAMGGVVTPYGELPLHKYQVGGVAYQPQVSIIGEGSMAEAYVPLPDGRSIPVDIRVQGLPWNAAMQAANDDEKEQPTITINQFITIQGNADGETVREMKLSAFQLAERQRSA